MRRQNSNMDHFFKEKLDNYQQKAPIDVWGNLETHLNLQSKTRKKAIYQYIAAASIAVIAISATLFTLSNIDNSDIITENISAVKPVETESNTTLAIKNGSTYDTEKLDKQETKVIHTNKNSNELESIIASSIDDNKTESRSEILQEKLVAAKLTFFTQISTPELKKINNSNLALINPQDQNKYSELKSETKVRNRGKWSIGMEIAPTYAYRYLSGSDANQESVAYFNKVEDPINTFSGGLNIQYNALKRLTVQTGVYYAQMGQSIGNLIIYDNKSYDLAAPSSKENYVNSFTLANSIGNINVNSKYVFIDKTNIRVNTSSDNEFFFDSSNPDLNQLDSRIQQTFKYIDIPLLFRYKIIDKKADINIIAGAGVSFLIGNEVSLIINDAETIIGKTNGINQTNFTGNIGLGIELPLINKVRFRLEPGFKYYLNALNTSNEFDIHPYSFSVFTGFCLSL
jgi:hypothetical protein